jgi:hypothetical protein
MLAMAGGWCLEKRLLCTPSDYLRTPFSDKEPDCTSKWSALPPTQINKNNKQPPRVKKCAHRHPRSPQATGSKNTAPFKNTKYKNKTQKQKENTSGTR